MIDTAEKQLDQLERLTQETVYREQTSITRTCQGISIVYVLARQWHVGHAIVQSIQGLSCEN